MSRKFKFHNNRTRITGTLYEDQYTLLIVSHSDLLRTRNVSDKCGRENQNTHFMCNNFFSKIVPSSDNVEKYCRARQTIDDNIAYVH